MVIELLRHYKVDHHWKRSCSSMEFRKECEKYDQSGILTKKDKRETDFKIYTSTLKRSQATARSIFPKSTFIVTELLDEVPVFPYSNTHRKLPITFWLIMGRIHWRRNKKTQLETIKDTKNRMEKLLEQLETEARNCILVGHGFFFYQFSKFLEKRSYSRNGNRRLSNGESCIFST